MISRMAGAFVRGLLVLALVVAPSLLVPGASGETRLLVTVLGMFGALLTFAEYAAPAPGLIDFRDASPFNRLRFTAVALTLLLSAIAYRAPWDGNVAVQLLHAMGLMVGNALDFSYSPLRALYLLVPSDAGGDVAVLIRASVGLSLFVSVFVITSFLLLLKTNGWPSRDQAFNLWVNLPTFDPTAGRDVVARLRRLASVNFVLAAVLPISTPLLSGFGSALLDPAALYAPQTMIWIVALWAFVPTSCLMRAIALHRLASMIADKRRAERKPPVPDMVPA